MSSSWLTFVAGAVRCVACVSFGCVCVGCVVNSVLASVAVGCVFADWAGAAIVAFASWASSSSSSSSESTKPPSATRFTGRGAGAGSAVSTDSTDGKGAAMRWVTTSVSIVRRDEIGSPRSQMEENGDVVVNDRLPNVLGTTSVLVSVYFLFTTKPGGRSWCPLRRVKLPWPTRDASQSALTPITRKFDEFPTRG